MNSKLGKSRTELAYFRSNVKCLLIVLFTTFLLTACGKHPSHLACEVWEEKRKEAGTYVDYWAKYPTSSLTNEEKMAAAEAANLYLSILREMSALGCKF